MSIMMQLFQQRDRVFEQFHLGKIGDLESECQQQKAFPLREAWMRFFNYFALFAGSAFVVVGVLFFFAFNWSELGRFDKLGLIQIVMVIVLLLLARIEKQSSNQRDIYRRTYLFVFSCLTGILFGLIGQIYQTGADTYQLFLVWSLAITPFTWCSRCQFHWLLWIGVTNIAALLFINLHFRSFFGLFVHSDAMIQWFLVLFNGSIIVIWHGLYSKSASGQQESLPNEKTLENGRLSWTRSNVLVNLLNVVVGINITVLAIEAVFSRNPSVYPGVVGLAWILWGAGIFYYYRYQLLNRFVLSGLCLSIIVIGVSVIIDGFNSHFDLIGFFISSMFIIVGSAVSAKWLRSLNQTKRANTPSGGRTHAD
jgi:uncharacterized membrane protein